MKKQQLLREIWEKSEDYIDFIENAHKEEYGIWSIKKILKNHGIEITEREIENILNGG